MGSHLGGPMPNIIRVGDLELDRRTQQVKRGTQQIELSSKEYQLLEFLMDNAGHFVSRSIIIGHVWDRSFDAVGNLVEVYVSQLRNKIDVGSSAKLVHIVQGIGYSICEREPETGMM